MKLKVSNCVNALTEVTVSICSTLSTTLQQNMVDSTYNASTSKDGEVFDACGCIGTMSNDMDITVQKDAISLSYLQTYAQIMGSMF